MNSSIDFILGGARSGKSAYAERLALASGAPVSYIATARIGDAEFAARVAHHRARRPAGWALIEAPLDLAEALRQADGAGRVVLIDCLTLWLANLLCPTETGPDDSGFAPLPDWEARLDAFADALPRCRARVLVVSNEIGLGVIPMGTLTRRYVDELGRLNQRIAALSQRVTLMVAGLPMTVKAEPDPDLYRHP
jgi:adenosylcobinamide kinase / adenosylcobinamide-phosphate guanylyltransferase